VAVVAIVLTAALWHGRRATAAGVGAALALWAAWVGTLRVAYGVWPFIEAPHFGAPLAGVGDRLARLGELPSRRSAVVHLLCLGLLQVEAVLAVFLLRLRADPVLKLTALLGAAMALTATVYIYEDYWSYTRVFAWLPLALWLTGVQTQWRVPVVLTAVMAVLPLATVARVVIEGKP
jgi:hypothetical protein